MYQLTDTCKTTLIYWRLAASETAPGAKFGAGGHARFRDREKRALVRLETRS
jgi:hypothetical protein